MSTARPHYLTIGGKPLCQCEGYHGGLIEAFNVTCGHRSRASALLTKKRLQAKQHGIRLVAGFCPAAHGQRDVQGAVRQPLVDVVSEFRIRQDNMTVAQVDGPTIEAEAEIMHYAAQYRRDGDVTIQHKEAGYWKRYALLCQWPVQP